MNEKEIGEIRRRLRPGKNNISHIRGCYVNDKREVVSLFDQPLLRMSEEEISDYLTLLKRTLTGTLNKNLLDIRFETRQVAEGEEHKLLMTLRDSDLQDEEAVKTFFRHIIDALTFEGSYLILLAHDTYDVPYHAKDGERSEDASDQVFSYIVCSICPVKGMKPTLSYDFSDSIFHNRDGGWAAGTPQLGFLFPAFDDRATNLYDALYYTHDLRDNHREFTDAVFHAETPMPAEIQKETFQTVLEETLADECSYEVIQAVSDRINQRIEEQRENRESEPPVITRQDIRDTLQSSGVSDEHTAAFEEKYDEAFGVDSKLSPKNLVNGGQTEIRTPDVVIHVNPERSDLIETRTLNGSRYLLICADEGVEVNGIQIRTEN